jgi:hypothetical protein
MTVRESDSDHIHDLDTSTEQSFDPAPDRALISGTATLVPEPTATSRLSDDRELARFLVGLLLLGKDEIEGLASQEPSATGLRAEEESRDEFRHLALGLLARGQRRAGKALRTAYAVSRGTAHWTLDKLDRWTDGWLMRPIRFPIEKRIRRWQMQRTEIIEEGKLEEQGSRDLAAERVETIVQNVFDQVAESQELDRLIMELVGKKSVTYTGLLLDNLRSLTATADHAIEAVLRRLMRRTPRRELAPSPLAGRPQTMYETEGLLKGGRGDE